MDTKTVALAGGSGFIGRAIARRLVASGKITVRVLTRDPKSARAKLDLPGVEFVRADLGQPASLTDAVVGADTIVDAIQFDGYPVENPRRGLTFERIDYGGVVALIEATPAEKPTAKLHPLKRVRRRRTLRPVTRRSRRKHV